MAVLELSASEFRQIGKVGCPPMADPRSSCAVRSASASWYFDVEQRTILLAAEDVGVAGTAARYPAVDRKLDRQCRVEGDMVGDLGHLDAEDLADCRTGSHTALGKPVISGVVGEDHVESNFVDPGVLAANRPGDLT